MIAAKELARLDQVFEGLQAWAGEAPDGYKANFLGVLESEQYMELFANTNDFTGVDSGTEEARLPEVIDGEYFFECYDTLDAIRNARDRFTMVELGGGYAARSVNAATALRVLNPLPALFVVVEPEPTHYEWAKQHFRDNSLNPDEHWFLQGAIVPHSGPALLTLGEGLFSNQVQDIAQINRLVSKILKSRSAEDSLQTLLSTGNLGIALRQNPGTAVKARDFDVGFVNAFQLSDVLAPLGRVDYLDVDIQCMEIEVLPECVDLLERKVRLLHIGTHTPKIHEKLRCLFSERGWYIRFDFSPNAQHETPRGCFSTNDGILSVENSRI